MKAIIRRARMQRKAAPFRRELSEFFDVAFYLQQLGPDGTAGVEPLLHYLVEGWQAGHDPGPDFSTKAYLRRYRDVAQSNANPLLHYVMAGRAEGRNHFPAGVAIHEIEHVDLTEEERAERLRAMTLEYFDSEFYLTTYTDVRDAGIDPLDHYVNHGWRETRNPSALFDTAYYLKQVPDLVDTGDCPLIHYVTTGRADGVRPHPAGSRLAEPPAAPGDADWEALIGRSDPEGAEVDVIVPVYRGHDDTLACLHSVLSAPVETPYELVVIDDCSPEPALSEALQALAAKGLFTLLRNDMNLGFVGTVNRGMGRSGVRDVVLLNADTVVYNDWLDRLKAHARPGIATVTPLSNNATIASYPVAFHNNQIALEVDYRLADRCAAACNPGRSTDIPTGVGFCMYITRRALTGLGLFDREAFGKGYGEENDFCMRALAAGLRNLLAEDVFVRHTGSVSFAESAGIHLASGSRALNTRYPRYPALIQRFRASDPGRDGRERLDAYRLAQALGTGAVVLVSHGRGGGIERHLGDLIDVFRAEGRSFVTLRIDETAPRRLRVDYANTSEDVYCPNLAGFDLDAPERFETFLAWLRPGFAHIHSFFGLAPDCVDRLEEIIRTRIGTYYFTWHDQFSLVPHPDLLDAFGRYRDVADPHVAREVVKLSGDLYRHVDIGTWRERRAHFLSGARAVIAPSGAAARMAAQLVDEAMIRVRPHREPPLGIAEDLTWMAAPASDRPLRIAVIGAIGGLKGSDVLSGLARHVEEAGLPIKLTLIGFCDQPLPDCVTVTGPYRGEGLALEHLKTAAPHLCLFPGIGPETYNYTLTLPILCGVPVAAFDIGAQGERVRDLGPWGAVLDTRLADHPARLAEALLRLDIPAMWAARRPVTFPDPSPIARYYGPDRDENAAGAAAVGFRLASA